MIRHTGRHCPRIPLVALNHRMKLTLPQMRVLHRSAAHHTPFLQLPEWPQYRLFCQYLTETAPAAGHTLPGSQDMKAAYRDFKKQHPCPVPAAPPYTPTGSNHEPVPPVTGPVPPLTLLLALNEVKPPQTTVIHHGAKWRIPKHHMTAKDPPKVPQDSGSMPRTCSACDPNAPTTPWPVLHLIAGYHTHPTAHLPPQAHAWVAPWFHRTDANPTVAWNPDHKPPVAIHHNAHLATPRPCRNCHLLQHVRTRQNGQARAPLLSTPPLLPHTGTPNTNPHVPRP